MLIFAIRRFIGAVFVLIVASLVTFVFTATTYDPLAPYRAKNPQPPKAFFAEMTHQLHMDQPVMVRYWNWLTHLVNFDWHGWYPTIAFNFGTSVGGASVSTDISTRLGVTVKMIVGAVVLAAVLAVVLGVIAGVRHNKPIDLVITIFTFILLALPTFWFAALLKQGAISLNDHVFHHQYFFTLGTESPAAEFTEHGGTLFWDRARHLILPVISLGLLTAATLIPFQRASMIEVLDSDYMRLARAKGVRNRTVIRRHGLRNALIPLVTVMTLNIGALFGGAIITERVFVWNAMGTYLNTALTTQDTYAVIGWVVVSALFVIIFNLVADLLYATLDPRIRLS